MARLKAAAFITLFLAFFVLNGFVAGFYTSVAQHGDLIVMRNPGSGCVAYDPDGRILTASWAPRADGRCHLSDYWWRAAFVKFWER